jgi:diguanylate cyclase (GGDEF)-like protein
LETSLADLRAEGARRQAAEVKLRHMAYHDYLTDLPNRRQLRDSLRRTMAQARASQRHAALLLLDLDHFKTINDSLGHDLGDELLRQVSRRLQAALAAESEPIRLGGDEFAVLLRDLAEAHPPAEGEAVRSANALIAAIARPFIIGDHELVIGASVGIVLISDRSQDEAGLMRHADMALYWAKSSGRGAVKVYAGQLQQEADERLRIERGLRLARERNEFELRFEPQLDAQDRVVGMEALLRWRIDKGRYVPPARFIAVAEETGLIHPLGDYVLNRACEYIRNWQRARFAVPARFSINVSPWQLAGPDFTRKVREAIDAAEIDPSRLTLEITESAFLNNLDDLAAKIRDLAGIGVQFSIDDFGTGYASLAHLRRLPFHELKIDRSFVHGMNPDGDKLIEAIIAIARHLQLRVVAEGVETPVQRTALANMGCDVFQGYLFSQPLAEAGFVEWLGQRQTEPAAAQ